jgi:hypothetical protein
MLRGRPRREPFTDADAQAEEAKKPPIPNRFGLKRPPTNWICPEPVPCHLLLIEPEKVWATPGRWPDHLCETTGKMSTVLWWRTHPANGPASLTWPLPWPLPVSMGAMLLDAELYGDERIVHAVGVSPFAADERAIFAVRVPVAHATLEVFGLMQTVCDAAGTARSQAECESDGESMAWTAGSYSYALRGQDWECEADFDAAVTLMRHARRWWRTNIQGRIMRGSPNAGRKPGGYLSDWSIERFESRFTELKHKLGKRPTKEEYCGDISMSEERLDARLHVLETTWTQLVSRCL